MENEKLDAENSKTETIGKPPAKYFPAPELKPKRTSPVADEEVKPQVEMMPKNEAEPENLSRVEKSIRDLAEEIANFNELKDSLEYLFDNKKTEDEAFHGSIVEYFNAIKAGFKDFSERVNREIDYARELELKIQKEDYSRQVYLLEKELLDERAKITVFIETIEKHNKEVSDLVYESLQKIDEKCIELKNADKIMQESIMKFRDDTIAFTQNEYQSFKLQCMEALKTFTENAQKNLEAVKNNSINFLGQCENDNKNLLKKIPRVRDGKFDFQSLITVTLGCLGIVGFLAQLFIK